MSRMRQGCHARRPVARDSVQDGQMSEFDAKAADWDTPERIEHARHFADAVRAHVPLRPDWRAIDVGAGTGLLGLHLREDLAELVLADPSAGMVATAQAKIDAAGLEDVRAIRFDVTDPPPDGAPFDLVVSLLMLHHVKDTEAALRAVSAMLVRGGWMGLIDLDEEDGSFHDPDQEGIHHRGFSRARLEQLAAAIGFTAVATSIVGEIERENGRAYPLFLLTGQRG
jgi:ubiquinone/menaquinone biosynthesis C-methylase UbiE